MKIVVETRRPAPARFAAQVVWRAMLATHPECVR
jgi:hypothetical protein